MLKDGVNEIHIKSYEELVKIICGKSKEYEEDLREKFIFRGLSNIEYKLISSALRKNKSNQLEINEFIKSDHEFRIYIDKN